MLIEISEHSLICIADTFQLYYVDGKAPVNWTKEGIVWSVDREKKFKNPARASGESLEQAFRKAVSTLFAF